MRFFIFVILIFLSFYSRIYANDTVAVATPTGIQFQKNENISMDNELLKISLDKIEVSYIFTNHSNKDQKLQVAFPLPKSQALGAGYPTWDELYLTYRFLDESAKAASFKKEPFSMNTLLARGSQGKLPSFFPLLAQGPYGKMTIIDFQRTVNDIPMPFNVLYLVKNQDDKDMTSLLQKNNIPLSAVFLSGFEGGGYLEKKPELKETLKRLKLLDKDDFPNWWNQTIYYWDQVFPANKTIRVGHNYTPYPGAYWLNLPKKGESKDNPKLEGPNRTGTQVKLDDFFPT